jgi:acyl-CoA thioesterase I
MDMKYKSVRFLSILLFFGMAWILSACNHTDKGTERASAGQPATQSDTVPQDNRPAIVAFGDSLTAGAGVEPGMNYPSQLQQKIDAEGYRYEVINAGVSGETSSQGLNRIQDVLDLHPAIAIIELGANDGLRGMPVSTTRQNLEVIINRFQSAGSKVILAGMRVPPNYGLQYANAFSQLFREVAGKTDVALIPFFLEGVGGNPALNQDDGIHPTAEGYKIVVESVWKSLKPLL